jgi:glycosyltransferase involved in cell wall biosynthesis
MSNTEWQKLKATVLFVIPHASYGHLDNRITDFQQHPDVPVVKRTLALARFFQRIIFVSGSQHSFDSPVLFGNIEFHTIEWLETLRGFLKSYDVRLLILFLSLALRYGHRLMVLNFSMRSCSVVISILSRILTIPFSTFFGGVPEQTQKYKVKVILDRKMLLIFSRNIATNNPTVCRRLQKIYNRTDFRLIPNFVEPQFKPTEDPREPSSVLYVGRLAPEKRVDHLLRAFAIVTKKIPEAHLYIAGRGSCSSTLKDLTNMLGLESSVHFLGWLSREGVVKWMNRCKVFVQPSVYEGFPNALLEAMASGMAVVAMNVPYAVWIVGKAGLFADPESIDSLAVCINKLVCDDKFGKALAEKASRRASLFERDTVVKRLVETIRD